MEDLNEQRNDQVLEQHSRNHAPNNKIIFIIIGIALVLLAGIWIWKNSEINAIRSKGESDYQVLKVQALKGIVTSKEEQLMLLAKPYVWAVRTEMMKGNISQVNLYALDMIKEKNIMRIAIANDSGMIVSSTNKKDEGKPFGSIGEGATLNTNETMVENAGDSVLIVTSPIMGFNKRLGTLFIQYAIQLPDFN
jgi:hypothetical protein